MAFYIEPCKGQVLNCSINTVLGTINLIPYLHRINVYETVCKSYITAQLLIYDYNNIIENSQLSTGDTCDFQFWSPPNFDMVYTLHTQLLKMKGDPIEGTLKYQLYTLDLITPEFFDDRMNTVRQNFSGSGSAAISSIYGQYIPDGAPLSIDTGSSSTIGSQGQSYDVNGYKPLSAINKIMDDMVNSQYLTNSAWMFYRSYKAQHLDQLANMIAKAQATQPPARQFIQKETWGSNFNDPQIYNAIIQAQAQARGNSGEGGRGGSAMAGVATQTQSVTDLAKGLGVPGMDNMSKTVSDFAGRFTGGGSFGGKDNVQTTNSAMAPLGAFMKTIGQASYSAAVKDGPQVAIVIPLQTGINITVGTGIYIQLIPPLGDAINPISPFTLTGNFLVTDIVHTLYTDQRDLQGSSALQLVKGPQN